MPAKMKMGSPRKGTKGTKGTKGKGKRSRKKGGGNVWEGSENSVLFSAIASLITMIFYRLSISPDKDGIVDYKSVQDSRMYVIYIHGAILLFIGGYMFFSNDGSSQQAEGGKSINITVIIITTLLSLACFIMWFKYGMDVPINPECSIDADGLVKDKDGTKRNLNASTFMFVDDVSFVTQGIILAILGLVIFVLYKLYKHNKTYIEKRVGDYTDLQQRKTAKDAAIKEQKKEADAEARKADADAKAQKADADTKDQRAHELKLAEYEGAKERNRISEHLVSIKNEQNAKAEINARNDAETKERNNMLIEKRNSLKKVDIENEMNP